MTDPDQAGSSAVDPLAVLRRTVSRPLPHPDVATLGQFTDQVRDWLLHHFATLPDQSIGRTASRPELEMLLGEPFPEDGRPFAEVLAQFTERVTPYAIRVNHPRFLAFIPGAPSFLSVLGDFLCAGTNFFPSVWLEAAGPSQVELVVLDWFKDLLGYPREARGILTSGGSEANLTALVVARETLDFADRARAVLYVTEQRHWSMDRAARIIGMHPDQVRPIPASADYRLEPASLAPAVAQDRAAGRLPWAVCANAGATNSGTVDPLAALADLCRQQQLWLHVDAAYGWSAILTDEGRRALHGIDRADSITLDPHKWFAQTFEAGCILIREGRRLAETFALRPDYMQDVAPNEDEINFADHGPALTRRFRALKIWLSVKVLGLGWFRALVRRSCGLAELAQEMLRRAETFEILCPRQLSIVCFRYVPAGFQPQGESQELQLDRLNLALIDAVRATGRAFLSSTRLAGHIALRFCFVNWRTTAADLEEIIQLLQEQGKLLD